MTLAFSMQRPVASLLLCGACERELAVGIAVRAATRKPAFLRLVAQTKEDSGRLR
jgi:hypothetical protein